MRNILARANRDVIEEFAWSTVLLAFDYDGTLAPIVTDPNRAVMRPRTRALLAAAAKLYPVVVISGRAQVDARRRLEGVAVRAVVGNHGVEPWRASDRLMAEVRAWHPILQRWTGPHKGVWIEDKGYSVAIHYRLSREKKAARRAIMAAAAELGDVRIIGGKQVVNILPSSAPHKGMALERERERAGCDTAIYIGDDETDEDVFALDQPGRLLSIRVGPSRASAAPYFVAGQRAVDGLLSLLVDLRSEKRARVAR